MYYCVFLVGGARGLPLSHDSEHSDTTRRISDEELEAFRALKNRRSERQKTSLLIYHRDGVKVVPLNEEQSVVVGRDAPSDVTIRDAGLSRQHVCIEVIDGEIWVEDLGSTNGTWVNGERVDRAKVEADAELTLGTITATVHALAPAEYKKYGLENHDRFGMELDTEVARARALNRSLGFVLVRARRQGGARLGRFIPTVSRLIRPFDRLALYSNDTLEILLPEADLDQALKLAEAVVVSAGDAFRTAVGVLPDHAGSAGELVEVTRRALHKATAETPIQTPALKSEDTSSRDSQLPEAGPVILNEAMNRVYKTVTRLASSSIPVLIRGETGTGKEVVARAIHNGGKRKGKPLIAVNCGAIPEQLVESTLFGHEAGAFTGANQRRKGIFEAANGGTVLLDEIGELPGQVQATLLRVLEDKKITRVGTTAEIDVDVRVIAATHRDLEAMCKAERFRVDLFYRLNTMILELPPLRERQDEIEPLVQRFIELSNEADECSITGIDPAALDLLKQYHWPGNVRELRNAIERAVVIAAEEEITVDDLPSAIGDLEQSTSRTTCDVADEGNGGADEELGEVANLKEALQLYEARLILKSLKDAKGDRTAAANRLGLPLRTMHHKMRQHGIKQRQYAKK